MELTVARWDDEDGECAGYWLVRQLPGFCIERDSKGWKIFCGDNYIRHQGQDSDRVWGKDWEPSYSLYHLLPACLTEHFPTRSAALFALEGFVNSLGPAPTSPLGELAL